MDPFNLVEKPWIPVRWRTEADEQQPDLVSLADAFKRGTEIADLDCAPHERISLTRLLVCIVHASSGAPEDFEGWDGFSETVAEKAVAYLNRPEIHPHFNLLGDGPRFLQEAVSQTGDPVSASKLVPSLATGNNPTLLDHSGMNANRAFPAPFIALSLLAFQNFYPLYGAGYMGRGPCSDGNAIHVQLQGGTLLQTVLLNLLDQTTIEDSFPNGIGRPIWECPTDDELELSTRTYLGRMVPRHRSLRLTDNLSGFFLRKESLEYGGWEPYREPSSTIVINRKDERKLLGARLERGIWRDLHSLTALRIGSQAASTNADPPPVFLSHWQQIEEGAVTLWTGALITDFKAKILDAIESTFTVPHQLFSDAGHNIYQSGVEYAEKISQKLYGAIRAYGSGLMHENPPVAEGQRHYWHRLDQEHRTLIQLAGDPRARVGQPGFGETGADDHWTELVRKAALEAYRAVCPQTTPRQIQAHAKGIRILLRVLYPKVKKQKTATA